MTDYPRQRANMVESQIRPSDISDRRLLRVLGEVPREAFVPEERRALAYMDGPVALSGATLGEPGRALLAPRIFAKLVDVAEIAESDMVLDVGCATGYSTAVIARLARYVIALESDGELAARASGCVAELGLANVRVVIGALDRGNPEGGPYDVIIIEGSIPEVPIALRDQLADGGRLVAVVSQGGVGRASVVRRTQETFGIFQAFDAMAPALTGFAKPVAFSF